MRDNFYHWFVVAILFALFLGTELARIETGRHDWILITFFAAISLGSSAGAVSSYRQAVKERTDG